MLLWADGFDHYGDNEANMLDGIYGNASNVTLMTNLVATGTHSIRVDSSGTATHSTGLRKVLPTAKTKMGAAARFYFPDFPAGNTESCLFDFLTSSTTRAQITVFCDANGRLLVYRGIASGPSDGVGTGTLLYTSDPILVASAWNHVEFQVFIDDTAGWIRCAVNGVHKFEVTDLDTQYNTNGIVSVRNCRYEVATQNGEFYLDDLFYYDFEGDSSRDTDFCPTTDGGGLATGYIGELQCWYLPPNGDTAQSDWQPSAGVVAYDMVDEVDPNDVDYIFSTDAGDLTEFELTDLPEEITYIRGLMVLGRMSKADAGAAMIRYGMKSVNAVEDAPERPVTVEPTYWWDFINNDPNTGAAVGTLTYTGQPANGETVTIGSKVYTYQTVLTDVDGNVLIGATMADSIANLAAAINLGAGSGVAYAASTTANGDVTAVASATTLVVGALVAGEDGNAIATSETVANASWGGATLSGGDAGSRWTRASLNAAWLRLTRNV